MKGSSKEKKEYWIVSINIPYYPYTKVYDDEKKAEKGYQDAAEDYDPKTRSYGGPVFLARVLAYTAKEPLEDLVEEE